MDLNSIPLFKALQNKLGYLSEREKVIAQNVANASTPGFTPTDLKPFSQQPGMNGKGSAMTLAQPTNASGVSASGAVTIPIGGGNGAKDSTKGFVSQATPDSETTLNGNQVVLEEQMLKMNESRSDYDAAIGFYQKSLSLLQLAIKKPGG